MWPRSLLSPGPPLLNGDPGGHEPSFAVLLQARGVPIFRCKTSSPISNLGLQLSAWPGSMLPSASPAQALLQSSPGTAPLFLEPPPPNVTAAEMPPQQGVFSCTLFPGCIFKIKTTRKQHPSQEGAGNAQVGGLLLAAAISVPSLGSAPC